MADEEPKRRITKQHWIGGGIGASLIGTFMGYQQLGHLFTPREVFESKLSAVEQKIDLHHEDLVTRFLTLDQNLKERDTSMEMRHNREMDQVNRRLETLEAAKMGVSRIKNN